MSHALMMFTQLAFDTYPQLDLMHNCIVNAMFYTQMRCVWGIVAQNKVFPPKGPTHEKMLL